MTKKINLLYVINSMNNGGAEMVAIRLAERLNKNIFRSIICSLSDEGPLRSILTNRGIPFYTLNKKEGKDFSIVFRLRRLLKKEKINIIHSHTIGPLLYSYFSTRFFKKIIWIHSEHINMETEISYSLRHFYYNKILLGSIDGFVSIANHLTEYFKKRFNFKGVFVTTIPNSIELSEFDIQSKFDSSCLKDELGIPSKCKIIGNISALREQKDHMTLIQSMEYVIKCVSDTVLVIAGEGECEDQLRRYVKEMKLEKNIIFLGYRSDVRSLLQDFDLFILPSLYEGLPVCVLEAMASGIPVVATNVDGTNELVRNGHTGLLVPTKSPRKMADAIVELISNPDKIRKMGESARDVIKNEYNNIDMIRKYEEFYESIWQKLS